MKTIAKEKRLLRFFAGIIKQERLKVDVKFSVKTRMGLAAYVFEGFFRDHVEISRGLLNELTEREVRAIGLHEIGHVKYNHYWKRLRGILVSVAPFFIILPAIVFIASRLGWTVPSVVANIGYFLFIALTFIWGFHFGYKRTQWIELQADSYAKRKIGDFKVVITALRKMMDYQKKHIKRRNLWKIWNRLAPMHPTLEYRIKNLKEDLVLAP